MLTLFGEYDQIVIGKDFAKKTAAAKSDLFSPFDMNEDKPSSRPLFLKRLDLSNL